MDRYHHLFGDLLRKRLGQATLPEQLRELHRRASQWHEEDGLLGQAVKHARAAGDFERVAEIAERAAGDSLLDARLTTLLRWVDVLPEQVLHAHPRLQIYRAWALYMNGHLEPAPCYPTELLFLAVRPPRSGHRLPAVKLRVSAGIRWTKPFARKTSGVYLDDLCRVAKARTTSPERLSSGIGDPAAVAGKR